MQHLRWTEEENDLLRTHFPKEGLTVASRFPQRSPSAIASHAYKTLRLKIAKNVFQKLHKKDERLLVLLFLPEKGLSSENIRFPLLSSKQNPHFVYLVVCRKTLLPIASG